MGFQVRLRDQPTEYLEELHRKIGEELDFRRSIEPRPPKVRPNYFDVMCPECHGHLGETDEEGVFHDCDTCKGDGTIRVPAVDCPHCLGKGCAECNYTGAMPEEY